MEKKELSSFPLATSSFTLQISKFTAYYNVKNLIVFPLIPVSKLRFSLKFILAGDGRFPLD